MKKVYSLLMMVATLSLTACGGDNDNKDGDSNVSNYNLFGTWKGYACADSNPNDLSTNHSLTLVFNSDGSGSYLEKDNKYTDKCSFTYFMEGDTKGKTYISARGNTIYFVIESGKMYVYGHGYGDDLDFLLTKQ